MDYYKWCESVGIIPDSETHEVWEYLMGVMQQAFSDVEDAIIKSDDSPKMILHEPYRTILSNVQEVHGKVFSD